MARVGFAFYCAVVLVLTSYAFLCFSSLLLPSPLLCFVGTVHCLCLFRHVLCREQGAETEPLGLIHLQQLRAHQMNTMIPDTPRHLLSLTPICTTIAQL